MTTLDVAPTAVIDPQWARAYCGPAHGCTWLREGSRSWPPRIVLASRDGPHEYRLVHDLRARRAARDLLGNTIYMPVPPARRLPGWSIEA